MDTRVHITIGVRLNKLYLFFWNPSRTRHRRSTFDRAEDEELIAAPPVTDRTTVPITPSSGV